MVERGGGERSEESGRSSATEPVSVVIPAYDEEASVGRVARQVQQALREAATPHEVIVVDDGSTDGTSVAAGRSGARVIRHQRNRGYGAALKTGILAARYDAVVITDADGTYPIESIPDLLFALREADLVIGARVKQNVRIPLLRRPAKWLLRRLAEYVSGERIPDLNSGLRAFRRSAMEPYFSILPSKFSFTTTQTLAMLCDHYRVTTISIGYNRREGKSKIVPWDFVTFVALVLRVSMLFNPLKVFVPPALMCLALGGLKTVMDVILAIVRAGGLRWSILVMPVVSTSALTLVLAGIQILLIGMMSDAVARKIVPTAPSVSALTLRPPAHMTADEPDRRAEG